MKKLKLIITLAIPPALLFFYGNNITAQKIEIGTQSWFSKNLDVSTFRNGDKILEAKTDSAWEKAGLEQKPAWCYYNNDQANEKTYGKLYNWYAVNDARGLAPKGWHVPSDKEWMTLTYYLGEAQAGKKMRSTSGWAKDPTGSDGNGFNVVGFDAYPGGYRTNYGLFSNVGNFTYWWSSTEYDATNAWYRYMGYYDGFAHMSDYGKLFGFSIRCIAD